MMLDSFHIPVDVLLLYPDHGEKLLQQLMPVNKPFTYLLAFRGKHKPPVFLVNQVLIFVQFLDHFGNGRRMHFQSLCNVRNPRIALLVDQLVDALQIILHAGCWHAITSFL
ncbi:hypothetical protein D3C72_2123590 [compost metagenome]